MIRAWIEVESLVTIHDRIVSRLPRIPGQETEDAALKLLALRKSGEDPNALIRMQHPSGGWPGFPGVGPPSAFHTGLALVALRAFQTPSVQPVVERAFGWLSVLEGLESHWLWRWKFSFFDKQVRFDPMKSGWPWVEGTLVGSRPRRFRSWRFGHGDKIRTECPRRWKCCWTGPVSAAGGMPAIQSLSGSNLVHTQISQPWRFLHCVALRKPICRLFVHRSITWRDALKIPGRCTLWLGQ